MIHIRLKGGLGNQMFQYAFAMAQAERLNTNFKIDCSALLDRARGKDFIYRNYDLDIFNLTAEFVIEPKKLQTAYLIKSSRLSRIIKKYSQRNLPIYKEKHFEVEEELIVNPTDRVVYDGWWQSDKYFNDNRKKVKESFCFKLNILPESLKLYDKITATNSVCLNVRRTDFLSNPTLNSTNLEYFKQAANRMATEVENPYFYIFSDDVEWCKKNLLLNFPFEVVGHEVKGWKFSNYLQLMIACKHFIIPNSSFAWWAVWLNENKNKTVIAPKNWFNDDQINTQDLIPKDWIRL